MEDPTATYVPHNPTAGLTTVGIRKDIGLFPGWMLLCYRKSKKKKNTRINKYFNQSINTESVKQNTQLPG